MSQDPTLGRDRLTDPNLTIDRFGGSFMDVRTWARRARPNLLEQRLANRPRLNEEWNPIREESGRVLPTYFDSTELAGGLALWRGFWFHRFTNLELPGQILNDETHDGTDADWVAPLTDLFDVFDGMSYSSFRKVITMFAYLQWAVYLPFRPVCRLVVPSAPIDAANRPSDELNDESIRLQIPDWRFLFQDSEHPLGPYALDRFLTKLTNLYAHRCGARCRSWIAQRPTFNHLPSDQVIRSRNFLAGSHPGPSLGWQSALTPVVQSTHATTITPEPSSGTSSIIVAPVVSLASPLVRRGQIGIDEFGENSDSPPEEPEDADPSLTSLLRSPEEIQSQLQWLRYIEEENRRALNSTAYRRRLRRGNRHPWRKPDRKK